MEEVQLHSFKKLLIPSISIPISCANILIYTPDVLGNILLTLDHSGHISNIINQP